MIGTSHTRFTYILLALLIAGCSGSQSGQQNKTASVSTAATPQPAAAVSASAPTSPAVPASGADAVVPATSTADAQSVAPPAETSAAAAPAQPAGPKPNQPNQAALAKQWDTTMEASGATSAAPLQPASPEMASSGTPHPVKPPQSPNFVKSMVTTKQPALTAAQAASHIALAKATQPASIAAELHTQPTASAHLDANIATKANPSVLATATGSIEARRRVKFAAVASQLQRTVPLRITSPNPPQSMMMLKLGNVGISNFDDAIQVHFAIQTLQNDWTDKYLDPRDTREFFCNAIDSPGCLFWMKTGDKAPVEYAMNQSQRYAIFWDPDKGIWDLQRVASNAEGGK